MVVAFPSARIFSGSVTLSLALVLLVWDKTSLSDGMHLPLTIAPSVTWTAFAMFGLLGLSLLADGFFRLFNET